MSELLTTKEVARYLKINEKKVYQLIKEGRIPCTRIAGKWLFPKKLIDQWIVEGVERERDIFISGSNDVFLAFVAQRYVEGSFPDSVVYYSCVGSSKGLQLLSRGKATLASVHLFDPGTGEYNIPFLDRYLPGESLVVVNLAYREQGFIVKKGNPLGIRDFRDLKKGRFVNRNRGSGTRLLIDFNLKSQGIDPKEIEGYGDEVGTHMDVGLRVLRGEADVGIGIRYVAESLGLDFVSIGWERFDLVIRKEDFHRRVVKDFISMLEPVDLSVLSHRFPGYDFKDSGKVVFEY